MKIEINISESDYNIKVINDNDELLHYQENKYLGKGETKRIVSHGEFDNYEIENAIDNIDSACNDIMYELMYQEEDDD